MHMHIACVCRMCSACKSTVPSSPAMFIVSLRDTSIIRHTIRHASFALECFLKSQLGKHYVGIVWFDVKRQSRRKDWSSMQHYSRNSMQEGLLPYRDWKCSVQTHGRLRVQGPCAASHTVLRCGKTVISLGWSQIASRTGQARSQPRCLFISWVELVQMSSKRVCCPSQIKTGMC